MLIVIPRCKLLQLAVFRVAIIHEQSDQTKKTKGQYKE